MPGPRLFRDSPLPTRADRVPVVPPGGTAGLAQQTQASQLTTGLLFAQGFGRAASRPSRSSTARRRSKVKTRRSKSRTVGRKRKSKSAKFVKGSAAAKRHMAKLRRMQKRKR